MELGGRIVVIGLGYVGLPLAVALARKFETIGFDIDRDRIGELRDGHDRTREVDKDALRSSSLRLALAPTSTLSLCRLPSTRPTGRTLVP
jgi:UDP-N-acetyl-D-glucosamine/UDP-N-acetyl-D-galactosamine dehydrogenase